MLRPLPFLQQLFRERVGIGVALGIETRTRITVPVPGAADIGPRLEHARPQSELAQPVELVQARHTRADDDGVVVQNRDLALARTSHVALLPGVCVLQVIRSNADEQIPYPCALGLRGCPLPPAAAFTRGPI